VSEAEARKLSNCDETGADESGLMHAAREFGFSAVANHTRDIASAWAFVRSNAMDGRPSILCLDSWGHRVTVIGNAGERVILIDPARTQKNIAENGIHPLRRRDLARRWRHPREEEPFYAIAIGPK
jgi:ABC-type bacteriocin/lantibiotic exporter with double-glycine peptidase domain